MAGPASADARLISGREAILTMPYKDRETYLGKQREFYYRRKDCAYRRKDCAKSSGVSSSSSNLQSQKMNSARVESRAPVSGKSAPSNRVNRSPVPLTPLTPKRSFADIFKGSDVIKQSNAPSPAPQSAFTGTPIQPFPTGLLARHVCPNCSNTGYSSPGTPCSYCPRGRTARRKG